MPKCHSCKYSVNPLRLDYKKIYAVVPSLAQPHTAIFKQVKIQLFQILITYKTGSADLAFSLAIKRGEKYLQESTKISRSANPVFKDLKAFSKYSFT